MSTQKRKFELFQRLQNLGFTYEEACQLRRIEITLQRWGELECGTDRGCIERDETSGKPYFTREQFGTAPNGRRLRYPVADREAGAMRRLGAIIDARNAREKSTDSRRCSYSKHVFAYHQGDCRGCNLYLLTRDQLTDRPTGKLLPLDQYYTRGLAVCA